MDPENPVLPAKPAKLIFEVSKGVGK